MAKIRVSSSFARSVVFTLCLALSFAGLPLPASTQSQQSPNQGGLRTQGAPSPNLPNLDATRNAKEVDPKLPAEKKASRCRWADTKCKKEKEKKAENLNPYGNTEFSANSERLMASAGKFDLRNWRADTISERLLTAPLDIFSAEEFKPVHDWPVGTEESFSVPESAATVQSITYNDIMTARADDKYRTGTGGEDLFSGNYNWSLPIMGFAGRSGHDLGLTLSYNSTMWIRVGNTMVFDPDYNSASISPGFTLGLPTLAGPYLNTQSNKNCYQLILPSGRIVELRQLSTGTFESGDSSFTRMTIETSGYMIVRTTDGTQFKYQSPTECIEIKDRNGNLITVTYNGYSQIDTITDTLGRVFQFNYGAYQTLESITLGVGYTPTLIALFSYVDNTLYTNFAGLSLYNVSNGMTYPVLSQVYLPKNNSTYIFEPSTYGQVYEIRHVPGGLERSKIRYNLPITAAGFPAQSDCPKFTQRTDTAYEWNTTGVNTLFQIAPVNSNPGADICGQVTTPDGTVYKEFAWATSWQRGLVKETQTLTGSTLQKKTETTWDQDIYTSYQNNPRAIESKVIDVANGNLTRRTVIGYVGYNLPADVYEYDSNQTTLLRRSHTDYNLSSTYTSRRIIGLPSAQMLYDGNNVLQSKVTYSYDDSGFLQNLSPAPVNHDGANYGVGFVAGRANLTKTRRYDVNDASGTSYVESSTGYYISGSPAFTRDALNHQTNIFYTDNFSNVSNTNTHAYPTQIQDPDGYWSYIQYHYHWGEVTRTTDPKGASVLNEYAAYGRLWRTTNEVNGAYTRYEFASNQYFIKSYSTINNLSEELYSITVFDGHDRVRATVSDHPGSSGQYRGVYNGYDTMGRLTQASNPTEINSVWNPVGDDSAGWAWSFQSYDWQGRPLVSTNQDGTTSSVSYAGCGCAGGQVVTIQDEGDGVLVGGQPRRRQQKITYDTLGRVAKSQTLNWDATIYSTTINVYNVRNQITSVKEYSGNATGSETCPSAACQKTDLAYDGHGRLQSRKLPIESAATTYSYFADDTVQTMTDARGASATYAYNNRKLVTGITYGTPAGIAATPNVTFGYDAAGNRLWMEDGPGRMDYSYDMLSRLQTETRTFDALSGTFQFSYTYNLAGQVKTITDNRFSTALTYNYDKTGQFTNLTGTGYGSSQTDFTSTNIPVKYRAWGGIKEINFGDNLKSTYSYGTRFQPTSYKLLNAQSQVQDGSDYQYYPDNRIKFASNLVASNPSLTAASAFDRGYKFDHAGRLEESLTGLEASGGSAPSPPSVNLSPYKQANTYDVWGNLTSRTNRFWRINPNDSATYVNNRRQGPSYVYDNSGNMLDDGFIKSFFDTANRQVRSETWTPPVGGGQTGNPSMPSVEIDQNLDGHGLRAKRVETKRTEEFVNGGPQTTITTTVTTTYYVRSSMAGGDIALELDGQGNKVKGYIYALGGRLAEHWTAFNGVIWRHTNPVTGTMLQGTERSEFDPLGAEVGNYDPWVNDPTPTYQELKGSEPLYIEGGDPFNARSGCTLDGLPISCSQFLRRVDNSSVQAQSPNGSTPLMHLGGGLVVGSYYRDAGFAEAVATFSRGSERFPVRVLDQIGFSKWLGIRAGFGLTGWQQSQSGEPPSDLRKPYPCVTAEALLKWDDLQVAMNGAFAKSQKEPMDYGGTEFGGWVVWDRKKKEIQAVLSSFKGEMLKTPNGTPLHPSWNEERAWKIYSGGKENLVRIIDFHTHPSGNGRSNGDAAGLHLSGRPLAIVVQGINKWSIYNGNTLMPEATSEEKKKCLPLD